MDDNSLRDIKVKLNDDTVIPPTKTKTPLEIVLSYISPSRERSDRENLLLSFLSSLFFNLANLMVKIINYNYPNTNGSNIVFNRYLCVFILNFTYMKLAKVKFEPISTISSKPHLAIRICSAYFAPIAIYYSLYYLRFSTALAFFFCHPICTSVFSAVFLGDQFRPRNIIGLSLCFLALVFYICGDVSTKDAPAVNYTIGILWGLLTLLSNSSAIITTKILIKELSPHTLNHYISVFSLGIAFFMMIINEGDMLNEFPVILMGLLGGAFFWLMLHFMALSYRVNNLIAISCISYMTIFYTTMFGVFLFGEGFTKYDIISNLLILGYNFYSIVYVNK
jgi:drug/metabolite transporter (DMT)-like permease